MTGKEGQEKGAEKDRSLKLRLQGGTKRMSGEKKARKSPQSEDCGYRVGVGEHRRECVQFHDILYRGMPVPQRAGKTLTTSVGRR